MPYCPACDARFPDGVSRCAHCDGRLRAEPPGGGGATAALPEGFSILASRHPAEVGRLLEALARAGVEYLPRAEGSADADAFTGGAGHEALVHVFVSEVDRERAIDIDRALFPELYPDAVAFEADRCPACGAGLASNAVECADCGLAFPEE